jgi:hypothetical protein
MDPNEVNTAIDLYKTAQGWLNTYWTLFNSVSLALVALVFGGKAKLPGRGKVAIAFAFVLFATSNNLAMGDVLVIRSTAVALLNQSLASGQSSMEFNELLKRLDARPTWQVQAFQTTLTLLLVGSIWAQHVHENRVNRRGPPT